MKFLLLLFLCLPANAERMVREGTPSTATSITVSSLTAQVSMGGSLVVVTSGTFGAGVTASSGTFTATGAAQYSVETSSSIKIDAGVLTFPDGSRQSSAFTGGTGIAGSGTVGKTTAWNGAASVGDGSMFDNGAGAVTLPATSSFTAVAGSTLTINGYSNVLAMWPAVGFSAITVATITFPTYSTSTWKQIDISIDAKNVAGANETFYVKLGTETTGGFTWASIGDNNAAASLGSSCIGANAIALSYVQTDAANVLSNGWVSVRGFLRYVAPNVTYYFFSGIYENNASAAGNQAGIGGFYFGASPGSLSVFVGVNSSCTSHTQIVNGVTGTLKAYPNPF